MDVDMDNAEVPRVKFCLTRVIALSSSHILYVEKLCVWAAST